MSIRIRGFIVAVFLSSLGNGLAPVSVVHAAGTVTNCATYGSPGTVGDLAWALQGGGAVTFACSGTIIVPEIVIATDTVIDGTGQTVALGGNNANRVLHVSAARLDLVHVTVTGGNPAYGAGGGLLADTNSTVTLTSCSVSGNKAYSGGGGLYASDSSTVTLTDSIVSGNSAPYGYGGGLYASDSSTVTLTDSIVSGNSAWWGGGGLFAYKYVTITLTTSTVTENAAGQGGGLYIGSSTVTLTNSAVSGNSAVGTVGGGLVVGDHSIVTLTNSTLSGNEAYWNGGAIYTTYSSTIALINSTMASNSATYGGGLYASDSSTVTLTDSTVSGNSAWQYGGGLCAAFSATVSLTNSTVSGNSAGYLGGGLCNLSSASLTLTNSTVSENSAELGGGLYAYGGYSTFTVKNTIVATQLSGADCFVEELGSITSAGYNLDSDGSCGLTGPGDLPNTDPLLGPLQDNGGPTWTQSLLPGSPATDAIPVDTNGCGDPGQTDQRGVTRPRGAGCDIGAYEAVVKSPAEQINDLIALVRSFDLKPSVETSLAVKLQDALAALDKKNVQPACSSLQDFINQTRAQAGKTITASQAGQMIGVATRTKAVLGCR